MLAIFGENSSIFVREGLIWKLCRMLLENFSKLIIGVGAMRDETATVMSWNVFEALLTFRNLQLGWPG